MAIRETNVAYPFTKSDRARDKIMSEVMLSKLHLKLANGEEKLILSKTSGDVIDEILIHGYYFKLNHTNRDSGIDSLYVFVTTDIYDTSDSDWSETFPEIIQAMDDSTGTFSDHECLFEGKDIFEEGNPENDFTTAFKNATGLSKDGSGGAIIDKEGHHINMIGGSVSDFADLGSLYSSFYIAEISDDSKTNKIWIKCDSNKNVINPYVYSNGEWQPLGAVYKSNATTTES